MRAARGDAAAVGAALRALLLEDERCRRRWLASSQSRGSDLSQAAVARVVATWLVDEGIEPEDAEARLPRKLKDRVRKALNGTEISAETLDWMIGAFDVPADRAASLREAFLELPGTGSPVPVIGSATTRRSRPRHITRLVMDRHVLGATGVPVWHSTEQVIQATRPMSVLDYRIDTAEVEVSVRYGGFAEPVRPAAEGWFVVPIVLSQPLRAGDVTSLGFDTEFAYAEPPDPVFRRGSFGRAMSVAMTVTFDRRRTPRSVEWCRWDAVDDVDPASAASVTVRADRSVQQMVPSVEHAIVGFRWAFD